MKLLFCLYLVARCLSGIVRELYATAVSVISAAWINGRPQSSGLSDEHFSISCEGRGRKKKMSEGFWKKATNVGYMLF